MLLNHKTTLTLCKGLIYNEHINIINILLLLLLIAALRSVTSVQTCEIDIFLYFCEIKRQLWPYAWP